MTDARVPSELAEELVAASERDPCWTAFEGLSEAERGAVVLELKARVDRLVRSDPSAALPVSEVLMRAGLHVETERGLALRGRAVALHSNGDKRAALDCYREAEGRAVDRGEDLEAARIRRSMVDVLHMSGDSDGAFACADQARETFQALGEERLLAQLELNVGNVYFRLEQFDAARVRYADARRLFEGLGDRVGLAFSDFNLGNLETNAYEFARAEHAFRSARESLEAEGMSVIVADCDYSLAYLEFRQGRFASAIQGLEAARELYSTHEKPSGAPLCDLDLAEIYVLLDLRRDGLLHAERAAARFEELELDYETAKARVLAGVAHFRLGDLARAKGELDLAHGLATRLGNDSLCAFIDVQRHGMVSADELEGAIPGLRTAWRTLDRAGHRFVADLALLVLARGLVAAGEASDAIELLERLAGEASGSRALERTLGPEVHRTLADAYQVLGLPAAALDSLRSAVEAIDAAYAQVPGADGRIAFFRRPHEVFVELARLLTAGDGDCALEALSLLERSRSRSSALAAPWRIEVDNSIAQARSHLDSLLSIRLDAELGTADSSRQESTPSDGELEQAERSFLRACRESSAASVGGPVTFDVGALESALDDDEVLLAYMVSEKGSRVFVVHRGQVEAVAIDLDPGQLQNLQERLEFQTQKFRLGDRYVQRHSAQLLASSHEVLGVLGELLLGPLRGHLDRGPLVIVPFGPLHNLPFHALRLDGRTLIETHEVSYAPSVSALIRARRDRPPATRLLAAGVREETAPRIEQELRDLMTLFGASSEHLDAGELRGRLAADPPERGVLHIASHGSFRPGHPVFSGVRVGEQFLTVHDIRQMQLELDLVTLSGCETGRKVSVPGEELFSPDMALLAAGVRCVVSSLWVLRDEDSARLMLAFYRELRSGASARTAMARVQREAMGQDPHTWSWAPFVVVGDPLVQVAGA